MCARKPRRWRKDFPYYKIQVYNPVFNSWKDEPNAYTCIAEARRAVQTKFPDQRARIMVVDRDGRYVLDD
jgi:hypothetical protein